MLQAIQALLLPGLFELSVCSSAGTRLLLLCKAAEEAISPSALGGSAQEPHSSLSQSRMGETLPARASPCWG